MSAPAERALARISALLGPAACLIEPAARTPYEHGARYGAGVALCVARPADVESAAELMRLCAAEQISIVTQGANIRFGTIARTSHKEAGKVIDNPDTVEGIARWLRSHFRHSRNRIRRGSHYDQMLLRRALTATPS